MPTNARPQSHPSPRGYNPWVLIASIFLLLAPVAAIFGGGSPAQAVGSFDNAKIADYALANYAKGAYGGQCRTFVNTVVKAATGINLAYGAPNSYFKAFEDNGAQRITDATALAKGDIVQVGQTESDPALHTFIIVSKVSGTTYTVIDSNHNRNELVDVYNRNVMLSNTVRAYRLGTVMGGGSQPPASSGGGRLAFIRSNGGFFRANGNSPWLQMNGAGQVDVSVDGSAMAMVVNGNVGMFRMNDNEAWTTISDNITSVSISNSGRLAFVRAGVAYFRVNGGAPWQQISSGIKSVAVDDNAMAFVYNDGTAYFRVNDSSAWQGISGDVTSVDISDSGRMAFSRSDGAYFRPNGSFGWMQMAGPGAFSVSVDGEAMAMIVPWQGAIFRVNDNSAWTTIDGYSSGPTDVSISG